MFLVFLVRSEENAGDDDQIHGGNNTSMATAGSHLSSSRHCHELHEHRGHALTSGPLAAHAGTAVQIGCQQCVGGQCNI